MRLFAERGAAAVTIREIAAAAGVSPGLVMHHYGSKDGLKDAADRHAAAFFEEVLGDFARLIEEGRDTSLTRMLAARLDSEPVMIDYIRRMLMDGGETADALFAKLYDASAAGMRSLAATGLMRQVPDERILTAFLLANDLALLLLRRQLTSVTGLDPLSPEGLARWTETIMTVCMEGLLAAPERDPDQPSTKEEEH